jgi:hypothetical protein
MDEPLSRLARLRALQRLLDYAIAESRELEMRHLEHLLGAAAVAVGDMVDGNGDGNVPTKPARRREIRLVASGDARYKNENGSKN